MAIDVKTLIDCGKTLKKGLEYVPSDDGVIRLYSVYSLSDMDGYYKWKETSLRFLQLYYKDDADRYLKYAEEFEKHHFQPRYMSNMIGVLEACEAIPSNRMLKAIGNLERENELNGVLELEQAYLKLTTGDLINKSITAFHDWHAAACVLFDKWFYLTDDDWIKFQDIDGDGNGYVLKHEYHKIYSSYRKMISRLKDGRNIKEGIVTRNSNFPVKKLDQTNKINIFISYSHADEKWLERLKQHLKVLSRHYNSVEYWADTKLRGGDRWREEISSAINRANVAILLVSTSFLASDFIVNDELPPILYKAEEEGTTILPVIVSPCDFSDSELGKFQAINSPDRTLADIVDDEAAIERVFLELNKSIKELLKG